MQVEGQHDTSVLVATGERVRNAYVTYLVQEDSFWKRKLILHTVFLSQGKKMKAPAVQDGHASY